MLQKLNKFHQRRRGHAVFGLIELVMAAGFVDWALDTGNWLWWVAAAFLLLGVVQNFAKVVFWRTKGDSK